MLDTQELANYLNSKLNEYDSKYQFNLVAEVGKAEQGKINGVIKGTGIPSNIANYVEIEYDYSVEIVSPSSMANNIVMKILEIIGNMIKDNNDKEVEFAEGVATLTYSLGKAERYQTISNSGNNVPIRFGIKALYTEGSVTSTNKKWFLNDMEIPYTSEDVFLAKEGSTRKINNENYTKTLLTGQTKQYKFVFPYQANELCDMLQEDILKGDFKKQYSLKFVDGRKFTFTNPFETTVSIFANGNAGSKRAKVSMFDITFVDADNGTDRTKYYLALIDNPFDNQTEDTRWFDSQLEQREYFENKILIGADYEQIKAPNLNSLDLTSQVYENTKGYEMLDLVNKNYAIIKVVRGTEEDLDYKIDYFYYFVQSCQIGANGLMLYDLKLDSIQTYLFNPDLEFSDCYIEKSHLNRWVDNGDGSVSFDGTVGSKLFEREDVQNIAKRLAKRTKLEQKISSHKEVSDWFNDNVYAWVYFYCSTEDTLPFYSFEINRTGKYANNLWQPILHLPKNYTGSPEYSREKFIPSNMVCLATPIYKSSNRLYIKSNVEVSGNYNKVPLSYEGLYAFVHNTDVSFEKVYATKVSYISPFDNSDFIYEFENGNLVVSGVAIIEPPLYDKVTGITINNCIAKRAKSPEYYNSDGYYLQVLSEDSEVRTENYQTYEQITFNKNEIINSNKDAKFNPKLLSQDYKEINVVDSTENSFTYDLQKLNKNTFNLIVSESFTPDISKRYIRINNTDEQGLYTADTNDNLTGLVVSNDNSIVQPTSQYASMIANNKNFFLQNSVNRGFDMAKSLISAGSSATQAGIGYKTSTNIGMATGNKVASQLSATAGLAGSAVGIVSNIAGAALDYTQSKINEQLTIDNLRNAPASVQGAQGNVIFENMYSEFGIFIEEYDILPNEKNIVNDMMVKYGFTTNLIGQVRDYINSSAENGRKYFNYIKAQIQNIYGIPLSNIARADIRDRFMNGIRFWNSDTIDYSKENYEKWLEN